VLIYFTMSPDAPGSPYHELVISEALFIMISSYPALITALHIRDLSSHDSSYPETHLIMNSPYPE